MTGVAVDAVVDVSPHALVPIVRVGLGVAIRALEHGVVIRVGVAGSAHPVCSTVIHVEPGMIKRGPEPVGCRVAGGARRRKACRNVVRIRRPSVVGLVAAVAIRGETRVVVLHVATRARNRGVRARQRERRVVVIERRRTPRGRVVTHVALPRESR